MWPDDRRDFLSRWPLYGWRFVIGGHGRSGPRRSTLIPDDARLERSPGEVPRRRAPKGAGVVIGLVVIVAIAIAIYWWAEGRER
jgi:hypothetical protein